LHQRISPIIRGQYQHQIDCPVCIAGIHLEAFLTEAENIWKTIESSKSAHLSIGIIILYIMMSLSIEVY
jgi:hypothetical protein